MPNQSKDNFYFESRTLIKREKLRVQLIDWLKI